MYQFTANEPPFSRSLLRPSCVVGTVKISPVFVFLALMPFPLRKLTFIMLSLDGMPEILSPSPVKGAEPTTFAESSAVEVSLVLSPSTPSSAGLYIVYPSPTGEYFSFPVERALRSGFAVPSNLI